MKTDKDNILNEAERILKGKEEIRKEVIDKSKLPSDSDHPGEEISEENHIILGDQSGDGSPTSPPQQMRKPNYVLIIAMIVVVIVALFWGMKGCNEKAASDTNDVENIIIEPGDMNQ